MALAAAAVLGPRLESGLVVAPTLSPVPYPLRLVQAEHPQPGHGSRSAGTQALALGHSTTEEEQLLVLLSGGASSLLAVPAAGLTLDDKRHATAVLLRSGADIHALNTVRKHLSAIKGGRLAAASRASCVTLVVSDVVGDDLSVIASGPTVPDGSTYADAMAVLERFGGAGAFPSPVVAHLRDGSKMAYDETPKPGDPRLARSRALIVGGRADSMKGAAAEAGARGYHVVVLEAPVVGEARLAARAHVEAIGRKCAALPRPCCVISSGETTVTVNGHGLGGRNQEFALATVDLLAGSGTAIVCASVGTDGVDGPTDAAGAMVDPTSRSRARAGGLADPAAFLADNDSYHFFAALGDLVQTGPTGTNVGDLQVFLLA